MRRELSRSMTSRLLGGETMNMSRMAGWRNKPQNRVCCPAHDRTDYVRRTRRVELIETCQLTREAVIERGEDTSRTLS